MSGRCRPGLAVPSLAEVLAIEDADLVQPAGHGQGSRQPDPRGAECGADRDSVPYAVAENMDTPNPDPGEEYQRVNTQLFGTIDPPGNEGVLAEKMTAPFDVPADGNQAHRRWTVSSRTTSVALP